MNRVTEETQFDAPIRLIAGIFREFNIINSATPNVFSQELFENDGTVRTVTNFLGGSFGQTILIRGDGNLTIANNTHIITNTGADKLLDADKIYSFTYWSDLKWIEHA